VSLSDLSLEAVLELLVRSEASGLLVVEDEAAAGEVLLEGGRLYDARVLYPKRASGYRALDYLLGLKRGEAYLTQAGLSRPPTLAGDLLDFAFVAERAKVWARAERLPQDWGLAVFPEKRLGPLAELLERARGRPLAEVLLLYGGPPSAVGSALSSLAGAGFVAFRPPRKERGLLSRFFRRG